MRTSIRFNISILIYFLGSTLLSGQETIDFEKYFFQGIENPKLNDDSNISELKTSWIDKAEIRTETDEFDFDRQRYAFRVTPSSKKVNNAMHSLMDAYASKYSDLKAFSENSNLKIAYSNTIKAYQSELQLQSKRELLKVIKDQDKVYKKLLDTKNSYTVRWLDVQKDISELEVDIYEVNKRKTILTGQEVLIDWSSIIGINTIQESLIRLSASQITNPSKTEYQTDQRIIDQEIQLEEAESKNYFDFLQVDYKGPGGDPLQERISLTAAFQLPIMDNKTKLKLAELRNKKVEIALEENIENSERKIDTQNILDELTIMIEVYNMRINAIEKMKTNSQKIIDSYQAYSDPNPLFLLQQKEMIIKEEIEIAETKGDIIEAYIDYLEETGLIYLKPYKNYLTK